MDKTKRLFLRILLLSFFMVTVFVGSIWYFNFYGFNIAGQLIILALTLVLTLFLLVLFLGILGILLSAKRGQVVKLLLLPTKFVISYFVPLLLELASFFGLDKEQIQASFIELSNQLIDPNSIKLVADDILILVPHCIQKADCDFRVTSDLNNCQRCGGCQVQDLIKLKDQYGVHLAIATGGTLARKIIKDLRPKAIVAVACERDLSSGIQDIYPMPVIGVVNLRPNGPCFNTGVEIDKIKQAIEDLLS